MSVLDASDGIKIGSSSYPIYEFEEDTTEETVDLGTMSANEIRTLVFNNLPVVRSGSKVFAMPQNPAFYENLEIRHAWCSDVNQVSVIVKNDSDSAVVYSLSEQWLVSHWNTSPVP